MSQADKTILPKAPMYIVGLVIGTLCSLGLCTIAFIYDMCQINKHTSLFVLKICTPINCVIEGFVFLLIGIIWFYLMVVKSHLSNRIYFVGNNIKRKKDHIPFGDNIPAIDLNCGEITSANIRITIFAILTLTTSTNKNYQILIAPFSRKQIKQICVMINERGGTIDIAEMDRFLKEEYLFGKRKNKKDRSN